MDDAVFDAFVNEMSEQRYGPHEGMRCDLVQGICKVRTQKFMHRSLAAKKLQSLEVILYVRSHGVFELVWPIFN